MMKCKKFYKKIDIAFWFIMMGLPIIFAIVQWLGCSLSLNTSGLTDFNDIQSSSQYFNNSFVLAIQSNFASFGFMCPSFLTDCFSDLFTTLNISLSSALLLTYVVSWFVWVQFLHLIVDLFAFVPKFFHNFLRRVDKYDE